MEEEFASFFLRAGGLNSSRNLETLVSATLFLHAKGAVGSASGKDILERLLDKTGVASSCRCVGIGISVLAAGKVVDRMSFCVLEEEALEYWF